MRFIGAPCPSLRCGPCIPCATRYWACRNLKEPHRNRPEFYFQKTSFYCPCLKPPGISYPCGRYSNSAYQQLIWRRLGIEQGRLACRLKLAYFDASPDLSLAFFYLPAKINCLSLFFILQNFIIFFITLNFAKVLFLFHFFRPSFFEIFDQVYFLFHSYFQSLILSFFYLKFSFLVSFFLNLTQKFQ